MRFIVLVWLSLISTQLCFGEDLKKSDQPPATFANNAEGVYIEVESMPVRRYKLFAHLHEGYFYCFGGAPENDISTVHYTIDRYDPILDQWRIYDTLDFAIISGYSCIIGDDVFLTGGIGEIEWITDTVYKYNIPSKQIEKLTGYGSIIHSGQGFNDEGKFRLLGGHAYNPILDINIVFDPASNSWVSEEPLPGVLERHALAKEGTIIHLLGGRGYGGDPSNIHITYNATMDSYGSLASVILSVKDASAAYLTGEIYLFGGRTSNPVVVDALQIYNADTDSWREGTSLPYPIADMAVVAFNDAIYIFGGWNEESATNRVLKFIPDFLYCGDANSDGSSNIGDAVFINNFVFHNGPPPDPYETGEVNCDGSVNLGDAVYLINFIFHEGPEPCAWCK